jgi:hypothetical protein
MSKQKAKGTRVERELTDKLTAKGIPSRRVIMSGAAGHIDSRFKGDIQVGVLPSGVETEREDGIDCLFLAEVKARKTGAGFTVLERWLDGNELLFLRRDGRSAIVVMEWDIFTDIMNSHYAEYDV